MNKTDVKTIGYDIAEWITIAQERILWSAVVHEVMNFWVP
jgi:hypothetical protein